MPLKNTKSTITQKLRTSQKNTIGYKNCDQNIVHLLFRPKYKKNDLKHLKIANKIDHNSKTNRIFFSYVSERFSTIWIKKSKRLFLRGGGGWSADRFRWLFRWFISVEGLGIFFKLFFGNNIFLFVSFVKLFLICHYTGQVNGQMLSSINALGWLLEKFSSSQELQSRNFFFWLQSSHSRA